MTFDAFVLEWLGDPPRRVLEVGCGPTGDLARVLAAAGHDVLAVDPAAPDGPIFRRTTLEELDEPEPFDAVVASLSLHHVTDLSVAVERIAKVLRPEGLCLLDEFAPDRYDDRTAKWLHGRLENVSAAQGDSPPVPFAAWRARMDEEHAELHGHDAIRSKLAARFEERYFAWQPYLYRELDSPPTQRLEEELIAAGAINAVGYRYAGVRA